MTRRSSEVRRPRVAFTDMRKVIEHDLEDRIENLFAEFDLDAAAAASIGQVEELDYEHEAQAQRA